MDRSSNEDANKDGKHSIRQAPRKRNDKSKPKMTKEERRAKYTEIARKRRQKQQKFRNIRHPNRTSSHSIVCFQCRRTGHTIADCPISKQEKQQHEPKELSPTGVLCYRCGSTEHTLSACTKRKVSKNGENDLPFATCFLCKEKGHLVSGCPKNNRGIYVNGGSCRVCGSQQHRATDCPEKKPKKSNVEAGDDDISHLLEESIPKRPGETRSGIKQRKRRIVKF